MRPAVPVVLLLAAASGGGCRQLFGIDDTQVARDGGPDDAPPGTPDAPIDAIPPPDAGPCPPPGMLYGTGPVKICIADPLVGTIGVPNMQTFDTTASTTCLGGQPPEYCVIAAADLDIDFGGYLRLVGTRPLVVVAQRIQIDGTLDAGSRSNFNPGGLAVGIGPGANSAACDPGVLPTILADTGGGGAGGSFGGRGGAGGHDSIGGTGGGVAGMPMPGGLTAARGGCAGQDGAGPDNGEGGAGGGAVYLIATERIEVAIGARIIASGSGAQGGHRNNGINTGGGGGGSGGLIALDAPLVRNDGSIFTNGGGGGEGGRNGGDGGNSLFPTVSASGGVGGGGGQGGEGGAGTAGTNLDGEPGEPGGGADSAGGGGGGGAGMIKVFSPGGLQGNGGVESPPAM